MTEKSPSSAVPVDMIGALHAAITTSIETAPLGTTTDVENKFQRPNVGSTAEALTKRLMEILPSVSKTGFDTHHLRTIAGVFHLKNTLTGEVPQYAEILSMISSALKAGAELKLPNDSIWVEAATLGRALILLDCSNRLNERHVAVALSAKRLNNLGFDLRILGTGIDHASPAYNAVTEAISARFNRLGLFQVLTEMCSAVRREHVYEFDQYLFCRKYSFGDRNPALPFGFLFNLAVTTADHAVTSQHPEKDWNESIELARDLVAILDVEPYNKYWMINKSPEHMGQLLEEVGLYDHLFSLRQWPIFITPMLLQSFFGTLHDANLKAHCGWNVTDAVRFSCALLRSARTDPARITRADLLATGLDAATLDSMLSNFVHSTGQVNRDYTSPLAARSMDFMFRPLIMGELDTFVAPAASMIGPACYEVVAAAARAVLSQAEVSDLVGKGTERAVAALLRFRNLKPTFEGAKYNEGKAIDGGECDLVLEDNDNILFIECKAKPLTRATMAGEPGAALLDYAGGVIASQVQALQHERLLHDNGKILFDDGKSLELKGRCVTRLSVTLLDHGSFQDRFLFINLVEPLLRSRMTFDPKHPNQRRYSEVNNELDRLRDEMKAAERRGLSPWEQSLGAVSLSFGQLAVILVEANNLATLVKQIRTPATFSTMNPLLEYHYLRKQGLL